MDLHEKKLWNVQKIQDYNIDTITHQEKPTDWPLAGTSFTD